MTIQSLMFLVNTCTQQIPYHGHRQRAQRMIADSRMKLRYSGILSIPASAGRLSQYRKAQEDDTLCVLVRKHCKAGWPDEKRNIETDSELRQYWKAYGHLVIDKDGLLLHGRRIVVPRSLDEKHPQWTSGNSTM